MTEQLGLESGSLTFWPGPTPPPGLTSPLRVDCGALLPGRGLSLGTNKSHFITVLFLFMFDLITGSIKYQSVDSQPMFNLFIHLFLFAAFPINWSELQQRDARPSSQRSRLLVEPRLPDGAGRRRRRVPLGRQVPLHLRVRRRGTPW